MNVHAAFPCFMSILHVHAACRCCLTTLHFHAPLHAALPCCMFVLYPFCMSMQHVFAACGAIQCCMLLFFHAAYACCMSMQYVRAAFPCCMSLPHSHVNAACPCRWRYPCRFRGKITPTYFFNHLGCTTLFKITVYHLEKALAYNKIGEDDWLLCEVC